MTSRLCITSLILLTNATAFLTQAQESRPADLNPLERRRNAVHHDTVVATFEGNANSSVLTFVKDRFSYTEMYSPARFTVSVERDGRLVGPAGAREVRVEDSPGGVRTIWKVGGVQVTSEMIPLLVGRDTPEQDGAALLTVTSDPPTKLVVDCGDGSLETGGRIAIAEPSLDGAADKVAIRDSIAEITSTAHPLAVAVPAAGANVQSGPRGGQFLRFSFPEGKGQVLVAFAASPASARKLAGLDPQAARVEVNAYYEKLMACRVTTPVPAINEAFRSALYNLEYAWHAPYGWVESVNHWHALWHMQHTAGAEWIGQADRSRACTLTHAENLMPDGSVPQLMTYLNKRRDFGGSNQFWAWQARHYWRFTGDQEFAAQVAPALDRVIAQTFTENDPDGDKLLGWGLQIGNQEDYVATPADGTSPSIEGINMLLTRAELATGLGDLATAERCDAAAASMEAKLRDQLWLSDLGRFAYWRDPLGPARLDGQYHTFIYPGLWGVADPLEAWAGLRHVRDRLTGPDGRVYCSNNFPNHVIATVGTQGGAAQQPWAAWGFAAAGLRNEIWRPLNAVATWVTNPDHRGAWPEIADEPRPAYFSPPVGLFVAATVEALFGLQVDAPAGVLHISPGFPDDWPEASLDLPEFTAAYRRDGQATEYTVTSKRPFVPHVRWSIPPGKVTRCEVNGQAAQYEVLPSAGCSFVEYLGSEPLNEVRISLQVEPHDFDLRVADSVAEGDILDIDVNGGVESVVDPFDVLGQTGGNPEHSVSVAIKRDLLRPYAGYGRLGQLNFSRRTFFLECRDDEVTTFLPVDINVLPRLEAAPSGELLLAGETVMATAILRNNTAEQMAGPAQLQIVGEAFTCEATIPAYAQAECRWRIPRELAAVLSAGDNAAEVMAPDGSTAKLTFSAGPLFAAEPLAKYQRSRITPLPLPDAELLADTAWQSVRPFKAYGHMPWGGSRPPLEALADAGELAVDGVPGLTFRFKPRHFLGISAAAGRPSWTMPLNELSARKLYLLVIPFLDNHDMFSPVAQISVQAVNGAAYARTLHFPGDLDWWSPAEVVGEFATCRGPRPARFGLLSQLTPGDADWPEGQAPAFPQWQFWAGSCAVRLKSTVMNVVELDLGRATPLKSLTVSTLGSQPGLGLVGVVAETSGDVKLLNGTPWMPPGRFREPRVLFSFAGADALKGWTLEGNAFSTAAVPTLFAFPTLNSLAAAGEAATGKATSPEFQVGEAEASLEIELHGGRANTITDRTNLAIRLVDADDAKVLATVLPNGSHVPTSERVSLAGLAGKRLRLELEDRNTQAAYAWIGVRKVTVSSR